ncbi:MAG: hypothetical protein K2N64_06835 [Anaeroplasmataceae bacterium]|nr:hypothetical protein [Anaeroplasmataceae bacterium]
MKRKGWGFFLIGLVLFTITACSTKAESKLDDVIQTLEIKETGNKITNDFYVPKIMQYEDDFYPIVWSTSLNIITIKVENQLVFIDIDFSTLDIGTHDASIMATIKNANNQASKTFDFFILKEENGSNGGNTGDTPAKDISFTKKEFSNRLSEDGPLTERAFPSIGNPKMLVIPVNLKSSEATPRNLREIKTAFTGTSESTGWESVQSYYQKSSYGKMNMEITVLNEWFTPSKSASYYNSYSNGSSDGSTLILQEALEYYDSKIDFTEYDYDKDGYIDGVWLIYNYDVNYENSDSLFWAFTYWNYEENEYDGVKSYYYAWAGIDFMHPTKEDAGYYDPTDITIDAHTYIHETGHMLGLDDYYDYDENAGVNSYGFYGCDMMDFNIGDHSAISKLLLGWVAPIVVEGKGTGSIDLASFTTTGEFIIIADHTLNSIYDTYWTIEFYTNDGLNAHDKPYDSNQNAYGIRIMEIHAEKNIVNGMVTENSGTYQTGFKYDNSDESIMFADGIYEKAPSAYNDYSVDADCLYQANEIMKNASVPFELAVNSMTSEKTNITITIK